MYNAVGKINMISVNTSPVSFGTNRKKMPCILKAMIALYYSFINKVYAFPPNF